MDCREPSAMSHKNNHYKKRSLSDVKSSNNRTSLAKSDRIFRQTPAKSERIFQKFLQNPTECYRKDITVYE